jgi:hypothetical protein
MSSNSSEITGGTGPTPEEIACRKMLKVLSKHASYVNKSKEEEPSLNKTFSLPRVLPSLVSWAENRKHDESHPKVLQGKRREIQSIWGESEYRPMERFTYTDPVTGKESYSLPFFKIDSDFARLPEGFAEMAKHLKYVASEMEQHCLRDK